MTAVAGALQPGTDGYAKEVTAQNFMPEVIQPSMNGPVLVFFMTQASAACKQFLPVVEKVVEAAKGRLRLAKVDVERQMQLAQQMRVQSVPMIYIFLQGQPVDAFAGALPEAQLQELVGQFLQATPEEEQIQAALEAAGRAVELGDYAEAENAYRMILSFDPEQIPAMAGLAKCLIASSHLDDAEAMLALVPEAKRTLPEVESAAAALKLARQAPASAEISALEQKVAADPLDHAARFELATAFFAGGRSEEALDALLAIIAKDKDWNEGKARAQLLTCFEALGVTHPLTVKARRRLSSILFA
jgi:putative thioredoxin